MREAKWERRTKETEISGALRLDGAGEAKVATGIGFFDHMLEAWCRFALFDLELVARGDLEVDAHHTVEDCGIVLGRMLADALGEKKGVRRVADALLPMDEALAQVAVDFSGRGYLAWTAPDLCGMTGAFPCETAEEFFRALALNAGATLHVRLLAGRNRHHMLESIFKGTGLVMGQAAELNPRVRGVFSTKGTL
ncbi:MAG: imidazoleglycerol-phosphate dehydratase HisB [Gracilibacteraceae bacterium]|jgi:imidazoleglycerol-phosphate dehydratase|nr:imidazoleglycerol-phosphate dehydratase HisB [Gracilibacteraceae bacterium]